MSLAMIAVPVPGEASTIQAFLLNIINLDLLQTGQWLGPYLDRVNVDREGTPVDDYSFSYYFENCGYESMIMLKNLGSTLVFMGLYLGLIILAGIT